MSRRERCGDKYRRSSNYVVSQKAASMLLGGRSFLFWSALKADLADMVGWPLLGRSDRSRRQVRIS